MMKNSNFREIAKRYLGPPVNIEAIIRSMNIDLDKKAELDSEIAGQLEKLEPGRYKISANKADHYYRQRFTMAHELGHYMLHAHLIGDGVDDSKAYRSTPDGRFFNENIDSREETEANAFAAKLLMPKSKILEAAQIGCNVRDLAKIFQVSQAAMNIRLEGLGYLIEQGRITAEAV